MIRQLALLLYTPMAIWCQFVICGHWTSGELRGVSDLTYMVLGIFIPIAGQLLTLFFPWMGFVVAASVGLLYWLMSDDARAGRELTEALLDDRLKGAEEALARNPDNAAAEAYRNETLEELRQFREREAARERQGAPFERWFLRVAIPFIFINEGLAVSLAALCLFAGFVRQREGR